MIEFAEVGNFGFWMKFDRLQLDFMKMLPVDELRQKLRCELDDGNKFRVRAVMIPLEGFALQVPVVVEGQKYSSKDNRLVPFVKEKLFSVLSQSDIHTWFNIEKQTLSVLTTWNMRARFVTFASESEFVGALNWFSQREGQ